jgi:hypothetical protein
MFVKSELLASVLHLSFSFVADCSIGYIDGAVFANNPSLFAISKAMLNMPSGNHHPQSIQFSCTWFFLQFTVEIIISASTN